MSIFHDVRLPDDVEKGAMGGPQFSTTVAALSSGHEQRNINWSQARAKYNISYGISRKKDLHTIIEFFYARRGQAYGFRFKDWADYQVPVQSLALGDGSTKTFQAFKRYTSGETFFDRTLTKLVPGTVTVYKDGVVAGATVNHDTGSISFGSAPAEGVVLTYSCEFDVPVRFAADELNISMEMWDAGTVPVIELVEIRS